MSGVDYPKVVDLLADTIKELNQPCVAEVPAAPAAPAERTAAERKQDAADVLRALLHALEGGADAGAATESSAGGAAAEHNASAEENRVFRTAGGVGVSAGSATSGLGAGASTATPKPAGTNAPTTERQLPSGVTTGFCRLCFMQRPFVLSRPGYADTTGGANNGRCAFCRNIM